jgi:hypothetical protein
MNSTIHRRKIVTHSSTMSQDNKERRLIISRMGLVMLVTRMGLGDVEEPELYELEVFGLDWTMILS